MLDVSGRLINPARVFSAVSGKEKLFEKTLFDEKVSHIVRSLKVPAGILVDNDLEKIERIFVPFVVDADVLALGYAARMVANHGATLHVADLSWNGKQAPPAVSELQQAYPEKVALLSNPKIDRKLVESFDLMLVSMEGWKKLVAGRQRWLRNSTSVLIIND
jgi:hypothetical protein